MRLEALRSAVLEANLTIGGTVHTHSEFATAWAQAGREIPADGTTHADYFYGPIPVTEELTAAEVCGDYRLNTGDAIVRRFSRGAGQGAAPGATPGATSIDPLTMPAVLVTGHAPFCWGITSAEAAHNAVVLEAVARVAYYTSRLNAACTGVAQHLLDRHYFRKHGASKTYGQES
jgi:L-ribulose-5-phosphate 4-epimerase